MTALRLVCLPPAGGSIGTFTPWRAHVPAGWQLDPRELPGHGTRIEEPLIGDLARLADRVLDELVDGVAPDGGPGLHGPYALFGHSMGGMLAYEVAARIAARGLPGPTALVVSASRAPGTPPAKRMSLVDDDALVAWLLRLEAIPPELLAYRSYLAYALRVIRNDLRLTEEYLPAAPVAVRHPLLAFGGDQDAVVRPESLHQWRAYAAGEFDTCLLPGGHSYLYTHPAETLAALHQRLQPRLARPPAADREQSPV